MNKGRRKLFEQGLSLIGALLWPSLSWARTESGPEHDWTEAFAAQDLAQALTALGAQAAQPSEALHIEAAEIAENGAEVPLGVRSELAGTDLLAILVVNNPFKLAALFELSEGTVPALQTRFKFNESSEVIVLARAAGRFYLARQQVRVTLGGCSVDTAVKAAIDQAPRPMRARVRAGAQASELRVMMPHPMESGLREDGLGQLLPAHYITDFRAEHAGRPLLHARFGPSVAANPYLAFSFRGGQATEAVGLYWRDNLGYERSDEVKII